MTNVGLQAVVFPEFSSVIIALGEVKNLLHTRQAGLQMFSITLAWGIVNPLLITRSSNPIEGSITQSYNQINLHFQLADRTAEGVE